MQFIRRKQIKKTNGIRKKIQSPAVVLYGENENKLGKPTIRNLISGKEKSVELNELANEIKKTI